MHNEMDKLASVKSEKGSWRGLESHNDSNYYQSAIVSFEY